MTNGDRSRRRSGPTGGFRGQPERSGAPRQITAQSGQTAPATFARPASYVDEAGRRRPALFDGEALAEAERWREIKSAQLRRFFGAVMAHLRRIELGQSNDIDTEAAVNIMKASATYAAARDRKHEPIRDFFTHHATLAGDQKSFALFARHFEAVVAYHKQYDRRGHDDR
jgi:CRISPR-associated protein Csm2